MPRIPALALVLACGAGVLMGSKIARIDCPAKPVELKAGERLVILDERGDEPTSVELARRVGDQLYDDFLYDEARQAVETRRRRSRLLPGFSRRCWPCFSLYVHPWPHTEEDRRS